MSSGNAKIGHPAPNFKATAVMPDGQFRDISLSDYKGKSNYIRFLKMKLFRNLGMARLISVSVIFDCKMIYVT